ncbi:MAG: hypothetical protein IPN83_01180 [Holophagales bacterium]|nr:hypothetical protein [Holophagales bacterium]
MAPLVGDAAGDGDVLVARATPAGAGALAIVRLTGPAGVTLAVARRVAPRIPGHPVARRAYLSPFVDEDGGVVDEGLVLWFESPASSTGEEVVELQAHGSPAVVEALVSSAVARGARRARPGEFTRRALANGKIDLLRAEGIGLLAAAASRGEARRALGLVRGELSGRVHGAQGGAPRGPRGAGGAAGFCRGCRGYRGGRGQPRGGRAGPDRLLSGVAL